MVVFRHGRALVGRTVQKALERLQAAKHLSRRLRFRLFNFFYEQGGRWMMLAVLPRRHPLRLWIRFCGKVAKAWIWTGK